MPDGFQTYSSTMSTAQKPAIPTNVEAEQILLGTIMAKNSAYDQVSHIVHSDQFAERVHGLIFEEIARLVEEGSVADAITLASRLVPKGALDAVGGKAYLAKLMTVNMGVQTAASYARIIHDAWLRRELVELSSEITSEALSSGGTGCADLVEKAAQRLSTLIVLGDTRRRATSIKDAVKAAIDEGERSRTGQNPIAASTGLPSLDKAIRGLRPGHLVLVGGRPSMGKSAIARTIALNVACGTGMTENGEIVDNQSLGRPVGVFSLEETDVDYGAGSLAQLSGVPIGTILDGSYTVDDADRLLKAQRRLDSAPLTIFDKPRLSLRQIAQEARDLRRRRKGLSLIVVDYLQLMADPSGVKEKRIAVGDNAKGLKDLAKELDCTILLLSQLGRQVDDRTDRRPVLRDLMESGDIEAAADVVMFPYREEYYLKQARPKLETGQSNSELQIKIIEWQNQLDTIKGQAELLIPKVRRGPSAIVDLYFNGPRTRFEERRV